MGMRLHPKGDGWVVPSQFTTVLEEQLCPGDSLLYNGEVLWPGDQRNYVFQDENGCDSLVSLSVLAFPELVFEMKSEPICPGTDNGSIEVNISAGDGPFAVDLDGGGFSPTLSYIGLQGGNHIVRLQDAHGCFASQTIEIQAFAPLTLQVEYIFCPATSQASRCGPGCFRAGAFALALAR